jgi:hypothetical protein
MYFLASIRYTKSLGNSVVYVRLRDGAGNYWDWSNMVWALAETGASKLFLTEEPDSSPTESLYVRTVDIPALTYSTILEYVDNVTHNTIGSDVIPSQTVPSQPLVLPQRVKLGARLLTDVGGVNNYDVTTTLEWTQGDRPIIFFQLVDMSAEQKMNPPGRRYMPPVLSTGQNLALACTVTDIDSSVTTTAVATAPFVQDPSIYQVDIFGALTETQVQAFSGTYGLKLALETGPTLTASSTVPNPTVATLVVNETIPTNTPQTGFVYVNGSRLPYIGWAVKTFTFAATAPVLVANSPFWVVVPPILNGYTGMALSITLAQSEF